MKFNLSTTLTLLALITGTLSAPEPIPDVQADKAAAILEAGLAAVTPRDAEGTLEKRGCSYTTGCRSVGSGDSDWTGAGKYCGFCFQVDAAHTFINTHIYQLNGGTNAKSCCDYGINDDCKKEWNSTHKYRKCANNGRGF